MSNEKPLHQKSAQGKIPGCQKHSVEHLSCTVPLHFQKNSESSEMQHRFFVSDWSPVHSALVHCTQPLLPGQHPRTHAWRLPGVGGALSRPRRRVLRRPNHRSGRQVEERRHNAVPRRPLLPSSTCGSCMPAHARGTVAVARQARNVLPAADGPAPPRSIELAQSTKSKPG